jgi:serine O-acetyltransferase
MYRYQQMCSDLRKDWWRYVVLFRPAPRGRRPETIRVLLSSPGFTVVAAYRVRYWIRSWGNECGSPLTRLFLKCLLKFLNRTAMLFYVYVAKTYFSLWPSIGPGLYLSNKGGILLGARAIGSGCTIHHNVTLGMDRKRNHPDVGNNVWIGPGCVIYGGLRVGDGAALRPGTVLGKSVPDRCVVEGNPGRIVRRNFDNAECLASPDFDASAM